MEKLSFSWSLVPSELPVRKNNFYLLSIMMKETRNEGCSLVWLCTFVRFIFRNKEWGICCLIRCRVLCDKNLFRAGIDADPSRQDKRGKNCQCCASERMNTWQLTLTMCANSLSLLYSTLWYIEDLYQLANLVAWTSFLVLVHLSNLSANFAGTTCQHLNPAHRHHRLGKVSVECRTLVGVHIPLGTRVVQ